MSRAAVMVVLAALGLATGAAEARELQCTLRIVSTLQDDLGNTFKTGESLPVNVARQSPTGLTYCAHGGSCMPQQIEGRVVSRLENCHPGPQIMEGDRRLVPGR